MSEIFSNKYAKVLLSVLFIILAISLINGYLKNLAAKRRAAAARKAKVDKSKLERDNDYYKKLAQELKQTMEGIDWIGTDRIKPMEELNSLNDDEFKHVYNLFNKGLPANETLKVWVYEELMEYTQIDNIILKRMEDLELI